jgi:hypothetical protein
MDHLTILRVSGTLQNPMTIWLVNNDWKVRGKECIAYEECRLLGWYAV